ncbi:PAS domain-containing protein [Kitasatospora sp. NPDC004289]
MSSRPIRGAARLAAILDALPDALLLVNSNGTVVDANAAAVQAMQTPGTSLVGRGVLDLLPEFDPSRIPGSMRPAPREPEGLDRPVRMTARRTDGTTFPVEVSGNDFTDEGEGRGGSGYTFYPDGGSSAGELLLLLVRDLSGRLGVEAELRRQHKQTEMILRAAAEGVLGVDLDGRVVLVNPAAAHILDYRASELGGRELHPLVQHSQADGTPLALEGSALLDTLLSGRKHRVRGAVLWRKDGTPVTVDLTTAPVRDGDQLVGAVMTFTDRTRELALIARNEHLTAVLESELGGALEDLRSRIDGLAEDPAGSLWPEANWTLRRLADECRRFGTLIEGVLDHQRFEVAAESGREQLDREPVPLDEVVKRAVEQAGELVGAGRVRYSVHAASVEVVADRERLARALAHLVADVSGVALSLDGDTGEAPMVVLAAAQRGEVARIEVRGPARAANPVHLPIARGTVERHGGVLQRHDLPARGGTTYVVELPLDPATAALHRTRPSVPKETDTAMLPDLPEVPPAEEARGGEPAGRPADRAEADGEEPAKDGEPQARTPIALGPGPDAPSATEAAPAEDGGRVGRRRRGAPAPTPGEALALPGVPDPGTPVYPGLERSLTEAQPAAEPTATPPTGRRRRLALPAQAGQGSQGQRTDEGNRSGSEPEAARGALELPAAPNGSSPALPPALPEPPSVPPTAHLVPAGESGPPQPVGTGLGELAPPRPMGGGFAGAFPNAFPQQPAGPGGAERAALPALTSGGAPADGLAPGAGAPNTGAPNTGAPNTGAPNTGAPGAGGPEAGASEGVRQDGALVPAAPAPRTPPRPTSELALAAGPSGQVPDESPTVVVPAVDGGPRRLLVWPEPEPATERALQDRGFLPVTVRSREEVDSEAPGYPAALFVDPLTGPITRTALQSLRTAALNNRVPVLVTAGLGQATRDAAYGAEPAVLLRALAPKDSENHAPRVLLVESDPDVAAALIGGLERRGMHVEHATDENDAVSRASSVQPNLVVMDLLQIRRRRLGLLDWLRANDRLHRTPLVVYTSVDLDPAALPRLRTGETVLFLAERSTSDEVQARIVDLLARIGSLAEPAAAER